MLSAIMLSVPSKPFKLSVFMLNVVAPFLTRVLDTGQKTN
jgi:hypothetical protein